MNNHVMKKHRIVSIVGLIMMAIGSFMACLANVKEVSWIGTFLLCLSIVLCIYGFSRWQP